MKKQKQKISQTIKNNYSTTKNFTKPIFTQFFIDTKPIFIEHPKTMCKFSKAIRQDENVSQVSSADKNTSSFLYSETKKKFLMKKRL